MIEGSLDLQSILFHINELDALIQGMEDRLRAGDNALNYAQVYRMRSLARAVRLEAETMHRTEQGYLERSSFFNH